ncbi:MAG: cytochrome d ubiquinol oxidase subunit II, partial [Rhodococcus sp. (in: high G+C Gram-positive bacteria)]
MGLPEIWFVAIAVLFTGYFVLEGFDFGVGMLMPIIGRDGSAAVGERRRRAVLNTIGPVWDGNEVWLITAGGALFAAFPEWYATLFSGFYLPLLLILVALILRICAIEWRGKIDDPVWRRRCDLGIGIGSWVPAVLWGVAFANIVSGVAIDENKKVTAGFFDLLGPYALLGGAATAVVFALHGAVFIALKTSGDVHEDAARMALQLSVPAVIVGGGFALWTQLAYGKEWTWIVVGVAAASLLAVV